MTSSSSSASAAAATDDAPSSSAPSSPAPSPPPSPSDAALIARRKTAKPKTKAAVAAAVTPSTASTTPAAQRHHHPAPPPPTGEKDDAEYIPAHLRQYVFHSQDDFYVSRHFDPVLLSHLMFEGFLPIASEYRGECFLIPKLHRKRCVLVIDGPEHVPKSVKKRGKKFKLELNAAFDEVVKGCHDQHGISWLYPPIVEGFRKLYEAGESGVEIYPDRHVRFYSVELVDVESGKVAAGELGYTVGRTYTSLTGFSRVSGAGTVQLHALGRLLYLSGFLMWDLGMSMPYKLSLGAEDVERDLFLDHLYKWRHDDCLLELHEAPLQKGGVHVKALFEIARAARATPMKKSSSALNTSTAAGRRQHQQHQQHRDESPSQQTRRSAENSADEGD